MADPAVRPPRAAVYPGSFDPLTLGHLDVVERSAALFDRVVVAVLTNTRKEALLPEELRARLIAESVSHLPNVGVDRFPGLLTEYLRAGGARTVVRGLRSAADLDAEWQMAAMNKDLLPDCETVFLSTRGVYAHISSSLVKEVVRCGGEVGRFVPPPVAAALGRLAARGGN